MTQQINLAVVGATGTVGEQLLTYLQHWPIDKAYALASEASSGDTCLMGDHMLTVEKADDFDFSKVNVVFMTAGEAVSKRLVPKAQAAGCLVIDNTAAFRDSHPLIIPEINAEGVDWATVDLIANPNCVVSLLALALAPVAKLAGLSQVTVSTYQSLSGAGRAAMAALVHESACFLNAQAPEEIALKQPIGFNVLPVIGPLDDNGVSDEERKIETETAKILNLPHLSIQATAVRVPVFYGHAMSVTIESETALSLADCQQAWTNFSGVSYQSDATSESITPRALCEAEETDVIVSRLRIDSKNPKRATFWVVGDNLKKGAALNALQLAERCRQSGRWDVS